MTIKNPLTSAQTRTGIAKLGKRIEEIDALVPTVETGTDPRIPALESKIAQTLSDLLTASEWNRFLPRALLAGDYRTPPQSITRAMGQNLRNCADRAKVNLQTVIELFEERLQETPDSPEDRARRTFSELPLHPFIAKTCTKLFDDGHYAQAVENACKVLEFHVKLRSGKDDASGTDLMMTVFSAKNPVLKFNDQQNDSDRSEQQGMMYLYAGAMAAIRNPRAHGVIVDHPEQAIEHLMFISMLMKALDRTTLV